VAATTERAITAMVSPSAWFTVRLAATVDKRGHPLLQQLERLGTFGVVTHHAEHVRAALEGEADPCTWTGKALPSLRTFTALARGRSPAMMAAV